MSNKNKIDIVIPWVDGSDENWIKEKNKYSYDISGEGVNNARFRNWDTLKYTLRSIEEYMPWYNKIYLVTNGQIPTWLNLNNPKLELVNHKEYIPKEYTPTFNSHTIELNIHRIKKLSEKFIYFNDDYLITNFMKKEEFFFHNLPCDSGILNVHCPRKNRIIHTIAFNDTGIINEHFNIIATLKNKKNWFNYKYGVKNIIQNFILSKCPRFPGFKQFHTPNAYLKSTFEEVWDKEYGILNETCMNKFRNKNDVNQWIMRNYQLSSNNFYPTKKCKETLLFDFENKDAENTLIDIEKALYNKNIKMICINDCDYLDDVELVVSKVKCLLEEKYPKTSSFEKRPK